MSDQKNTKRNRWLIAALGIIVLLYFGEMGYRKFYEEPTRQNEQRKEQLTKNIKQAKLELAKSKRAARQLEQLEQKSLPWNPDMARSRYRDWLVQLAEDSKLESIRVDSGEPVSVTESRGRSRQPIELYKRFTFTVRGRGSLGEVTGFLHDFYRGGHLHKIKSMSLNPAGRIVDMNVTIEALALRGADREAELTSLVADELALPSARDYQLIARRNFFASGGTQRIQLSAVTADVRGFGQAWFKLAGQRGTEILQVGESLSRASFEVLVVAVDETSGTATVNVGGQLYSLSVGQNLADAAPLQQ